MRTKHIGGAALLVAAALAPLGLGHAGPAAVRTALASTSQTYYLHGTATDDASRVAGSPTATFDGNAPTGTTDRTQTGPDRLNATGPADPDQPYWLGSAPAGPLHGVLHLDWYWSTVNAESAVIGDVVDVNVYSGVDVGANTGVLLGTATEAVSEGPTAVENQVDVNIDGVSSGTLLIQAGGHFGDTSEGRIVHYDSTAAPSSFTFTATPPPSPSPAPGPCTAALCFADPTALPLSGQTGSTAFTCYNPCGEPSLTVSPTDGTLYVSTPRTILVCCNTKASPVWKSGDDGASWSNPIFPKGTENATTGGDTELAVDKRGTVYEGELWLGSDSIYSSADKGGTWTWSPASHDVGSDREWFAYAPGEDALYGWYDGLKGLMVVKAPLTTPLGSTATEFFPIEHLVVPECIASQAVNCPDVADSVNGTPVLPSDVAPGRPSVSPVDGTLYFPFPYQVAGKGIGVATTSDGGSTFGFGYVTGAGGGTLGDTGNDFPVSAVDSAGTLYVAWVEDKGDGLNVYLSSSADKAQTWTKPVEVSKGLSKTALFPNIVAAGRGQVAVSWYGSSTAGDPNNGNDPTKDPKSMADASWDVHVAQTVDPTDPSPTFSTGIVQSGFHTGVICTMGAACTGTTRELLDFFDMKLDPQGALLVVYARDLGPGHTEIAFSREVSGCLAGAACGPGASVPEFPVLAMAPLAGGGVVLGTLVMVGLRRRRTTAAA